MNAKETLLHLMRQRKWYGDAIERRKAAMYKIMLLRGTLSYEMCCTILELLGYERVQDEVWQIKNNTNQPPPSAD